MAGPFPGVGGAALSTFDITLILMREGTTFAFADRIFMGWVPAEQRSDAVRAFEQGTFTSRDVRPADEFPHGKQSPETPDKAR